MNFTNSVVVNSTTFNYTVFGLTAGVYYDFAIQAQNEVGYSQISYATRIIAANAPNAPTGLQIIYQSSTAITVGWFAVVGAANGGSPITGY